MEALEELTKRVQIAAQEIASLRQANARLTGDVETMRRDLRAHKHLLRENQSLKRLQEKIRARLERLGEKIEGHLEAEVAPRAPVAVAEAKGAETNGNAA